MKNIWRMLALVANFKWWLLGTVLADGLLGLTNIASPYLFKYIVDQASQLGHQLNTQHLGATALAVLALLLALRILTAITDYIQDSLDNFLFVAISRQLRLRLFEQLMQLSVDYYERNRVGDIMDRASGNIGQFIGWLNGLIGSTLMQLFSMIFGLIVIFHTNWLAGLIVALLLPINFGISLLATRRTRPLMRQAQTVFGQAQGVMAESIGQLSTIRSFGAEPQVYQTFRRLADDWQRLGLTRFRFGRLMRMLRELLQALVLTAAVGLTFLQVMHGQATPGDIILVLLLVNQIAGYIRPLAMLTQQTSELEVTLERTVELLDMQPTVIDDADARPLEQLESIEFRGVSFHYPEHKALVLNKVSFKLMAGQTLALVGPSGVGKTTITKLLLRFYEPTAGQILINDRPVSTFTQASIRQHLGMVMQDVALFNETVAENLRFARPDASDQQLRAAAQAAHADAFIAKLADGYGTMVGERGVKLSGGEKQRVAVARAILRDPQLIVLDEATSALDSESEHHVQAGLQRLMRGRTAIVIAHRLSTVRQADQILVLQRGRVIERGTHAELADTAGGLYARLFKLQTEGVLS
ncbi:MAG TPA: ABC transporter ATP-binding protein [Candidatus Saccharimonadia bacterium]|nr:ABC transporter ATP-binding protein [Candidatus Saccharimonadia bacterium]